MCACMYAYGVPGCFYACICIWMYVCMWCGVCTYICMWCTYICILSMYVKPECMHASVVLFLQCMH